MYFLSFIIWSADPNIFTIPWADHPVRWYGLTWAAGFIISQQVMLYIFKKEKIDIKQVDTLTMYLLLAVIAGARLGHCLFYDPIRYLSNPIEIAYIWEGGLASHGGAIGMFVALYLFARKFNHKYLWVLDRLAIVTLLTGAMIRFGNFMNSEIIGIPTESNYGVVFARSFEDMILKADKRIASVSFENGGDAVSKNDGKVPIVVKITYKKGTQFSGGTNEPFYASTIPRIISRYQHIGLHFDNPETPIAPKVSKRKGQEIAEVYVLGIPRHPSQFYECIACLIFMLIIGHIWYHHRSQVKDGFMFGLFMILLWSERFLVEFYKENQEAWEADIPLNMGQWLSIPLFLFGIVVLIRSLGKRVPG